MCKIIDLEQEVEMTWDNNGNNKRRLISKGYTFTKPKDKFLVKAKDLSNSSNKIVIVQCDKCGKISSLKYIQYNRNLKRSGEYLCKSCSSFKKNEKKKHSFAFVKEKFKENNYILLSKEYINATKKLKYICPIHGEKEITFGTLVKGGKCKLCANSGRSGENHPQWNGGSSNMDQYLRSASYPWISDSLKNGKYKCDISKQGGTLVIHHSYPFKFIADEVFLNTQIPIKANVGLYTQEELDILNVECMRLHYIHGLGICLKPDIHKLFHSTYGYHNNTPDQYYEFKERYLKGEFNQ